MREKLKVHDGDTPGKVFEIKLEYPKPNVATMSNDMKCPICGTPLEYDFGYDGDYSCAKCGRAKMFGSKELWQELIRTRKALAVAVDALNKYTDASGNWWYGYEFQGHYEDYAGEYADKALEQITALEQKE